MTPFAGSDSLTEGGLTEPVLAEGGVASLPLGGFTDEDGMISPAPEPLLAGGATD
ncbi:MAG: hypothetical protein AMXMBFR33_73310 [Candidatus Xenobia bacterium]